MFKTSRPRRTVKLANTLTDATTIWGIQKKKKKVISTVYWHIHRNLFSVIAVHKKGVLMNPHTIIFSSKHDFLLSNSSYGMTVKINCHLNLVIFTHSFLENRKKVILSIRQLKAASVRCFHLYQIMEKKIWTIS